MKFPCLNSHSKRRADFLFPVAGCSGYKYHLFALGVGNYKRFDVHDIRILLMMRMVGTLRDWMFRIILLICVTATLHDLMFRKIILAYSLQVLYVT